MMIRKTTIPYLLAAVLLAAGCKGEKKAATYSSIYKERPVTVYIAPLQDNSQRKEEKYPQDVAFNAERNTAARHMYLTLNKPLSAQGYYVVPPMASKLIAGQEQQSTRELMEGDLKRYAQHYGVDAILVVTLHRWKEKEDEVILFAEYALRSCKSNTELMHSWVQASTKAERDYKGEAVARPADKRLMQDYDIDVNTALRCRLAEATCNQVLRDLPFSAQRRQFEQDRYQKANDSYFSCVLNENGEMETTRISMEAFEEECFIN
ncbi:MAG: hypothetical protein AUK63_313 [bacterium P3]|nr:MAG: hypothetical protein AUK63_313 [bacterium P3]KWW42727.1 MAG: hypothetical protein F083_131 [bacterium F083]